MNRCGYMMRICGKKECEATRIVDAALTDVGWLVKTNVGGMLGERAWPDRTYILPRGETLWVEWKGPNAKKVAPLQRIRLQQLAERRHHAVAIYIREDHRLCVRCAGNDRDDVGYDIDLVDEDAIDIALRESVLLECERWWREQLA